MRSAFTTNPALVMFAAMLRSAAGAQDDRSANAAKALLDRTPKPSEAQIKRALAANLCRCGTHNRIVRAVQRAAKEAA